MLNVLNIFLRDCLVYSFCCYFLFASFSCWLIFTPVITASTFVAILAPALEDFYHFIADFINIGFGLGRNTEDRVAKRKSQKRDFIVLSQAVANLSKPVAVRLQHRQIRQRVHVHLLFISSIKERLDTLLESPFNDFASVVDDASKTYTAVKLDNPVAETRLHLHVWLLLFVL